MYTASDGRHRCRNSLPETTWASDGATTSHLTLLPQPRRTRAEMTMNDRLFWTTIELAWRAVASDTDDTLDPGSYPRIYPLSALRDDMYDDEFAGTRDVMDRFYQALEREVFRSNSPTEAGAFLRVFERKLRALDDESVPRASGMPDAAICGTRSFIICLGHRFLQTALQHPYSAPLDGPTTPFFDTLRSEYEARFGRPCRPAAANVGIPFELGA